MVKGTKMYLDSDPKLKDYRFNIKHTLRDILSDQDEELEDEEPLDEEPEYDDDSYNPVDYVHVENPSEIDQEDYDL